MESEWKRKKKKWKTIYDLYNPFSSCDEAFFFD